MLFSFAKDIFLNFVAIKINNIVENQYKYLIINKLSDFIGRVKPRLLVERLSSKSRLSCLGLFFCKLLTLTST